MRVFGVFWEFIEAIVFALAIFVVVYWFLAQPNQVKGQSMFPTFHDGEYIITDKISFKTRNPERGEVVIFKSPQSADIDFIKRIIGLPGEKVHIANGKVFVNDQELNEANYLDPTIQTGPESFLSDNQEITVPEGKYFVLGDNRPNSSDSRDFGPIAMDSFIGRVIFRYFPLDRIGGISKGTY